MSRKSKNIIIKGEVFRPCKICKEVKPLDQFNVYRRDTYVCYSSVCKVCAYKKYKKPYYERNRKKFLAYYKDYNNRVIKLK